jgi:hypothetical protein
MRAKSPAKRADSSPPVPARISRTALRVVGVARNQCRLELALQPFDVGRRGSDFLARHFSQLGVRFHLLRGGQVKLALQEKIEALDDAAHFGLLA